MKKIVSFFWTLFWICVLLSLIENIWPHAFTFTPSHFPFFTIFLILGCVEIVIDLMQQSYFYNHEKTATVIERWGRKHCTIKSGFTLKLPFFDSIRKRIYLGKECLVLEIDTETADGTLIEIMMYIIWRVDPQEILSACYGIKKPKRFIRAYAIERIKKEFTTSTLSQITSDEEKLSQKVTKAVQEKMKPYGYIIEEIIINSTSYEEETE